MSSKISVIIVAFNEEANLERCINSVCAQTYKNIEIVLVDDGSTDKTLSVMKKFANRYKNIKLFSIKHSGVSIAKNTGIKNSTGDIIALVDADDWIDKNMFKIMHKTFVETKSDICMCKYSKVHKNIELKTKDTNKVSILSPDEAIKTIVTSDVYGQFMCNKIFKKQLFFNYKFKEDSIFEDADIIYKLVNRSKRVSLVNKTLYYYRQHPNSIIHHSSYKSIKDHVSVYENTLKLSYMKKFSSIIYHKIFMALLTARIRAVYGKIDKNEKKLIASFTIDKIKKLKNLKILDKKDSRKCFFVIYLPFLYIPKYWFAHSNFTLYAHLKNIQNKILNK